MSDIVFYVAVIFLIALWLYSAEMNYRERVEADDPEWYQIVHNERDK